MFHTWCSTCGCAFNDFKKAATFYTQDQEQHPWWMLEHCLVICLLICKCQRTSQTLFFMHPYLTWSEATSSKDDRDIYIYILYLVLKIAFCFIKVSSFFKYQPNVLIIVVSLCRFSSSYCCHGFSTCFVFSYFEPCGDSVARSPLW